MTFHLADLATGRTAIAVPGLDFLDDIPPTLVVGVIGRPNDTGDATATGDELGYHVHTPL